MSKMRKPEMSAVRFEENDVICASRDYLYMQGWSDNQQLNGTARTEKGGTILASSARGDILGYFGATTFYPDTSADRPYTTLQIIGNDRTGDDMDFDGYYRYNSINNIWERQ